MIEVKNGNGCQDLARETRSLLWGEGFTVVAIGNHIDFGMERTVIIYRPDATRVAQTLARQYFPSATLQPGGRLTANVDVRIILGQNLSPEKDVFAKLVY